MFLLAVDIARGEAQTRKKLFHGITSVPDMMNMFEGIHAFPHFHYLASVPHNSMKTQVTTESVVDFCDLFQLLCEVVAKPFVEEGLCLFMLRLLILVSI